MIDYNDRMYRLIHIESAKKIPTKNSQSEQNGYILELFKNSQKTIAYLSMIKPGFFKGFHLHIIRTCELICIKGKVRLTLYFHGEKKVYKLSENNPSRIFIPNKVAIGILNYGKDDAWIVNYTNPPYDPATHKGEQLEFTEEECLNESFKF